MEEEMKHSEQCDFEEPESKIEHDESQSGNIGENASCADEVLLSDENLSDENCYKDPVAYIENADENADNSQFLPTQKETSEDEIPLSNWGRLKRRRAKLKLKSALKARKSVRPPLRYTDLVQRALTEMHELSVVGLSVMQKRRRMPSAHSNLQISHFILTNYKEQIQKTPFNWVRKRVQDALDKLLTRGMLKLAGSETKNPNMRRYRLPVSLATGPLNTAGDLIPKIQKHILDMPPEASELVVHARIVAGLMWKLPQDMHTSAPAAICYAHFLESIYDSSTGSEGVMPLRPNAVPTLLQIHLNMKTRQKRDPMFTATSPKTSPGTENKSTRLRIHCALCPKTFNKKTRYRRHVQKEHVKRLYESVDGDPEWQGGRKTPVSAKKEFQCDMCEMAFVNEIKMAQHKQAAHDVHPDWLLAYLEDDDLKPKIISLWRSGAYQCPRCSTLTTSLHFLRKHVESRHKDEPYDAKLLNGIIEHSYTAHLRRLESESAVDETSAAGRKTRSQRLSKTLANYSMWEVINSGQEQRAGDEIVGTMDDIDDDEYVDQ